ncbi:MAG: hypothetical protein ISR77_38755, partial [Pirellulaceae bacterium]|nr:hypothetical protein [Pirellulaceae bacterium]
MRCLVTRRASWTEIISAKPNTGWRKRETCRPRRCRESRWSFSILASMRLLMSLRSQALEVETAFLHMTVALNCEITALCYPKAALFCFANALIAYNALSIVKGTIAVEHGREASEMMSHFYMAREILETTDGLLVVLPAERWEGISTISASAFVAKLRQICRGIDLPTSRTSIRVPRSRHRNVRATNKPSTSPPSESSINASKPMMKVL